MRMICSLPPPVHGQSLVNQALARDFAASVPSFTHHDIAPGVASGLRYHVNRVGRVLRASAPLAAGRETTVFLSSESGFGALYLLRLISIARLRGKKIFLHHQVYSYINQHSWLHDTLIRLAGNNCTHVLLSNQMSEDFKARFGAERDCATLHNAIFIDRELRLGHDERRIDPNALRVGFLGRLEASKGFDDFLMLVERLRDDPRLHFVVGGDPESSAYRTDIERLETALGPRLDLRGFVQGETKVQFFQDIDVLVFPSKYRNEASPMVCYEALAMGVPVLTTRVGAVADIVTDACGAVLEPDADLQSQLIAQLRAYLGETGRLGAHQGAAAQRYRLLEQRGQAELAWLRRAVRDVPDALEEPAA
jgi:glycosyltransferase involved in cell wall biosynthesis